MDYLYDHDNVEELGFGINFHDYDGLDYEDRCDRISDALTRTGLSIGDGFNSTDIFGEVRPKVYKRVIPPKFTEVLLGNSEDDYVEYTVPKGKNVFYWEFPTRIDKERTVMTKMTYVKNSQTLSIVVTDVKFCPMFGISNIELDICKDFKDEDLLTSYSSMAFARTSIIRYAKQNSHNPMWDYISWQNLSKIKIHDREYIIAVLMNDCEITEVAMKNIHSNSVRRVTPFVCNITTDLRNLKTLIRDPLFQLVLLHQYQSLENGGDNLHVDVMKCLTSRSRTADALRLTCEFIEELWFSQVKEYESEPTRDGYVIRVYIDANKTIRAYAITRDARIVYYNNTIRAALLHSTIQISLREALHFQSKTDAILAQVFDRDLHWKLTCSGKKKTCLDLELRLATQLGDGGSSIIHKVIEFHDGLHRLETLSLNQLESVEVAVVVSKDSVIDVKPLIDAITKGKRPIHGLLSVPAFQDVFIDYARSEYRRLDNLRMHFEPSSKTIDQFNSDVKVCDYFEYGGIALGLDCKLRLYYVVDDDHTADIIGFSVMNSNSKIIYCQSGFSPITFARNEGCHDAACCWEAFADSVKLTEFESVRVIFSILGFREGWFNRHCRINNHRKENVMKSRERGRTGRYTSDSAENCGIPKGCTTIDESSNYKLVQVVTNSHVYIVQALVTSGDIESYPVHVVELHVKNGQSRCPIYLTNPNFADFESLYSTLENDIDPIITKNFKF